MRDRQSDKPGPGSLSAVDLDSIGHTQSELVRHAASWFGLCPTWPGGGRAGDGDPAAASQFDLLAALAEVEGDPTGAVLRASADRRIRLAGWGRWLVAR